METKPNPTTFDLICIGAGAAGVFGAISCAELSGTPLKIAILEATFKPLTKVKVSGGGRCNVTHNCLDPRKLIENYPRGQKNLLNGFYNFGPKQMLEWLHSKNVSTKVESDGRIFPESNSSQTIIDCFHSELTGHGIELIKGEQAVSIKKQDNIFEITTRKNTFYAKYVLLATGGMPQGHKLANILGHTITDIAPSLFTLKSEHPIIEGLAGLSVQNTNVRLTVSKSSYEMKGPLLITHWGFSGPAILKLSSFAARDFLNSNYSGTLQINWIPDINTETLMSILKTKRQSEPKKKMFNANPLEIPNRLWVRFLEMNQFNEYVWADISDKKLIILSQDLTSGCVSFAGKGEFKEEFVTCGGVSLDDVDPKTYQSRIVPGLYFAGEILDIDGITGGFNFQNAWTSSRMAALDISRKHCNTLLT